MGEKSKQERCAEIARTKYYAVHVKQNAVAGPERDSMTEAAYDCIQLERALSVHSNTFEPIPLSDRQVAEMPKFMVEK